MDHDDDGRGRGPVAAPVRRACDSCHRRKVKCDGRKPCLNCRQSALICTFNAVPQKKGPKGDRARVLHQLRQEQQRPPAARLAPSPRHGLDAAGRRSAGSPCAPTPGLLHPGLMEACIDFFVANMYPTMPIFDGGSLKAQTREVDRSLDSYCLIASLCAFIMIQPGMKLAWALPQEDDVVGGDTLAGRVMVDEVLRVRKGYDFVESPSTGAVMTSFFLFASYFCLDKHRTAWYYMREATTLVEMLGMHREDTYHTGTCMEDIRRRRIFWLLFLTERAYALQRQHPLTLSDSIAMPTIDEAPHERTEISGFIDLVNLFKPFDEVFVGLWNQSRADCSTEWLAHLQRQLTNALPANLHGTETQAADLRVTQQWLRAMVWQLSNTNGYLSLASTENAMTFKYPIEIARDLVTVTSRMSRQAMEMHGIGLVEKLFDVTCTLTDVMACVSLETSSSFELGPRHYLNECLSLVSTLRGGQARYIPSLLARVNNMLSVVSGPIIPPLIYETHSDPVEAGFSDVGDHSNSAALSSTCRLPATLSKSSSDMSDFSLVSNDSACSLIGSADAASMMGLPLPAPSGGPYHEQNAPNLPDVLEDWYLT